MDLRLLLPLSRKLTTTSLLNQLTHCDYWLLLAFEELKAPFTSQASSFRDAFSQLVFFAGQRSAGTPAAFDEDACRIGWLTPLIQIDLGNKHLDCHASDSFGVLVDPRVNGHVNAGAGHCDILRNS